MPYEDRYKEFEQVKANIKRKITKNRTLYIPLEWAIAT